MRKFVLVVLLVLLSSVPGYSSEYNYITIDEMKARFENGKTPLIVDIQVEEEFSKHHLKGSVATYAYPVKNDEERARIDVAVQQFQKSGEDVVIVCPRGKGGAKRTYDYMLERKVPAQKLSILEKGMAGWPYAEHVGKM